MKQTIESGKTLLVNGPASVKVLSGKAEVFGYTLKEAQQAIVREGKRQPFHVLEKAELQVSLGANAGVQEVEAATIPASWSHPLETVTAIQHKPAVIMVVGKADSGKSSFTTFLVNKLVDAKNKVAVLDGDLGQSDIGPPTTVAYGVTCKPVTDLNEFKVSNAYFVGTTSPIQALDKTVEGLISLQNEVLHKKEADYIIINTDGWVEGEAATGYKLQLIKHLKPDLIVGVQSKEELNQIFASVTTVPKCTVEASAAVSERTSEKRTKLRELNYAKYLKDAKIRSMFTSYMQIHEKQVLPKEAGKEKGILVGLQNSRKRFLGIGILLEFNRPKKIMKVLTPVKSKPASVTIGRIRLDPELREAPL